jgi:hypothetical protein
MTTMSNKKVYYNNKNVKYVCISFRGPHDDIEGHFDHYISEYPDMLDDLSLRENNITQARINETTHFIEINLMNDNDEVISTKKIPYSMIMEVSIESEKFVEIPINRLLESEISSIK